MRRAVLSILAVWFILGAPPEAPAGTIDNFDAAVGTLDDATLVTANPNDNTQTPSVLELIQDDFQDESFNWAGLFKIFDSTQPFDVTFDVLNSGGVTEYLIVEGIANLSNIAWTDYHLQLGTGFGDQFIPLGQSPISGFGLTFDVGDKNPPPQSFFVLHNGLDEIILANLFNTTVHLPDSIFFDDGLIPDLDAQPEDDLDLAFLVFSLDIPDAFFLPGQDELTEYQFTLRQFPSFRRPPVIPEPMSVLLFSSGLAGAFFSRKKKI